MARILVAMSGGVDSSVAAALLAREGHTVAGAYMRNWMNEEADLLGDCPWREDIEDARAVAGRIGIPFDVVNLMRPYRERVVDYMLAGYAGGVTPNPDAMCNREIKFGAFLDHALRSGFEGVGTGHYARIERGPDGPRVLRGVDANKDQSYFLALLRPEQVARAWFPVGSMTKPAVRALARELGLATAAKKDSQGICFIGKVKMRDFLRAFVPDRPGEIVDTAGRVVGRHPGLHHFTLGQRRGVGVASNRFREAYVVVAKRPEENRLVVALESPEAPGLYASRCLLGSCSFLGEPPGEGDLEAQPRYRAPAVRARYVPGPGAAAEVTFAAPQRALAPGQVCALYRGDRLLGGGIIERVG